MSYPVNQLKRKLRQLKRLEEKIRFKNRPRPADAKLIWDVFFSTKAERTEPVKYPLSQLITLDQQAFKAIVEEYFYRVYFQNYQDAGLTHLDLYDPNLLSLLELPPYAGLDDIKRRFRELAKRYHPDHGGDAEKFIALMDTYEQLLGN